jgi:hypothetical protein
MFDLVTVDFRPRARRHEHVAGECCRDEDPNSCFDVADREAQWRWAPATPAAVRLSDACGPVATGRTETRRRDACERAVAEVCGFPECNCSGAPGVTVKHTGSTRSSPIDVAPRSWAQCLPTVSVMTLPRVYAIVPDQAAVHV